jgi:hypothetical protein
MWQSQQDIPGLSPRPLLPAENGFQFTVRGHRDQWRNEDADRNPGTGQYPDRLQATVRRAAP